MVMMMLMVVIVMKPVLEWCDRGRSGCSLWFRAGNRFGEEAPQTLSHVLALLLDRLQIFVCWVFLWFWNGALSCSYNQHHYHLHHLGNPPSGRMLLWSFGSSLCMVLKSRDLWQFRHTVLLGQEILETKSNWISLFYLFNALLEVSPACMGEQIWDRRCKLKLFKTCAKQDFIHQLIVFKL